MSWHSPGRLLLVVTVSFALLTFVLAAVAQADDPLDQQVNSIASGLNCPVCGDQSAAVSSQPMAVQMRDLIRKKLSDGESRDAIVAYFVDRYGESIKRDTFRIFLQSSIWWIVGGLVIAVGAAILFLSMRSRPAASMADPSGAPVTTQAVNLDDLAAEMEPKPRGKTQVYRPKRKV